MKHPLLFAVAAIFLVTPLAVYAEEFPLPGPTSLKEARSRAQKRLDQLNNMTEEEWQKQQERRAERRKKWESLTPEQREAKRQKMMEHRKRGAEEASTPVSATADSE